MEKQKIINKFLNEGYQLSSDALDYFIKNPNKIGQFLDRMDGLKSRPPIITTKHLSDLFKEEDVEILWESSFKKKTLTVDNCVKYFNMRYKKLKKILANRLDLVNLLSINKITPRTKNFSIISMVKEKDKENNSLLVEDTTGELTVRLDGKNSDMLDQVILDDVVGLVCEKKDSNIYVKNIVWPDIPLKRSINKADKDIYCLFISDFHMNSEKFKKASYNKFLSWINKKAFEKLYIFILGDISTNKKDINNFLKRLPTDYVKIFLRGGIDPDVDSNLTKISNPSLIKVENVILLLSHGDFFDDYRKIWKDAKPEEIMMMLLRRRDINPIFFHDKIFDDEPFILETIPDIFASGHFHIPGITNFKGTMIISNGSFVTTPIFWVVNLRTREANKLDFT